MVQEENEIFGTGQVRSIQTLELQQARFSPSRAAVQEAGFAYFTYLDHLFRPFLRIRYHESGSVDVRLLGAALLTFDSPQLLTWGVVEAIRFPIRDGLLVQRQMRRTGELRFELHTTKLVMAVEGYYAALIGPRGSDLRRWFYERSHAAIHRRVAERFLDEWLGKLVTGAH